MVHVWHMLKVYGVQKHHVVQLWCTYDTALFEYRFLDFCGLSLLCWLQDMPLCCACCALCWSCTPIAGKRWSYRQIWWRSWICTTICDLFWGSESARRALGSGWIFSQLAASLCRAARPQKNRVSLMHKIWMRFVYKGNKGERFCVGDQPGMIPLWSAVLLLILLSISGLLRLISTCRDPQQ